MQVPEAKNMKRPYEDLVHFRIAVPRTYTFFNDNGDECDEKETDNKIYALQGYKGDRLGSIIDTNLKDMGIEGEYTIVYKPDQYGRKSIILSKEFDAHFAVNNYKDEKNSCIFTLKPENEIWYKCIQLTTEEIDAARKVIDEIDIKLCKRLKTKHNM